jgi:hypothetical protein
MDYLVNWLSTYHDWLGMTPAGAITTVFGAFCFTFAASICWSKLTEDFRAAGGMLAAAIIVGTFWVMNHKLPGWGIEPGMHLDEESVKMQYGLIFQAHHYAGPWIDMGCAVGFGLWVGSIYAGGKVLRSIPRVLVVIAGGLFGGAMVGLIGFSGAILP